MPNVLTMRELAEASDDDGPNAPVITVTDHNSKTVARLRTVASHFEDATTFFPMLGGWEVWQLLNLFETYSGRYMYHCHILEHEDRDMMRPIVIMPAELMPFMS